MRVIAAAFFTYGSMIAVIGLMAARYPEEHWPWWSVPAIMLALFGAMAFSMYAFNRRGLRPDFSRKTLAEQIAGLEGRGLLERRAFRAIRAFAVEELEDEGMHYYLELADGSVLYLSGQYLYDHEPIEDDPELNQPRSFPCTEFEMLRHKEEGFVLDILCTGSVLEPETTMPPYTRADWKRGLPEDGQIITDRSYDALKLERE